MKTFCMIKPDAWKYSSTIIQRLQVAGFIVVRNMWVSMDQEQAESFYAEHKGKSFFINNIDFIISGDCRGLILEKDNAIQDLREFIGDTDPTKADKGTIRSDFGSTLPRNAIHASDSEESVEREINIFYGILPEEEKL